MVVCPAGGHDQAAEKNGSRRRVGGGRPSLHRLAGRSPNRSLVGGCCRWISKRRLHDLAIVSLTVSSQSERRELLHTRVQYCRRAAVVACRVEVDTYSRRRTSG